MAIDIAAGLSRGLGALSEGLSYKAKQQREDEETKMRRALQALQAAQAEASLFDQGVRPGTAPELGDLAPRMAGTPGPMQETGGARLEDVPFLTNLPGTNRHLDTRKTPSAIREYDRTEARIDRDEDRDFRREDLEFRRTKDEEDRTYRREKDEADRELRAANLKSLDEARRAAAEGRKLTTAQHEALRETQLMDRRVRAMEQAAGFLRANNSTVDAINLRAVMKDPNLRKLFENDTQIEGAIGTFISRQAAQQQGQRGLGYAGQGAPSLQGGQQGGDPMAAYSAAADAIQKIEGSGLPKADKEARIAEAKRRFQTSVGIPFDDFEE